MNIRLVTNITLAELKNVVGRYTTDHKYQVRYQDSDTLTSFTLELVPLDETYTNVYDHLDQDTVKQYQERLSHGLSFGAFDDEQLVGCILAEPHTWNNSVWVWEYHVAENYRGQGIGRQLMEALAQKAKETGARTIICETQNTNVPAIAAYRRLGFRVEGIDIAYYTNQDYPDGEVAVFMKRRLN